MISSNTIREPYKIYKRISINLWFFSAPPSVNLKDNDSARGAFKSSVHGLPGGVEQLRDSGHHKPFLEELPEQSPDTGVLTHVATLQTILSFT